MAISKRSGAIGIVALSLGLGATPAHAYYGTSYAAIPGVAGKPGQHDYRNWIKIEGNYWVGAKLRRIRFEDNKPNMFSGPTAPRQNGTQLAIAVSKHNPHLQQLMQLCHQKATIPEMIFAESSKLSRPVGEVGPIPAGIPDFYEYKLSNVAVSACSVDPAAPDQSFLLSSQTIAITNAEYKAIDNPLPLPQLVALQQGGETRSFVMDWLGFAGLADEKQCPKMNVKPSQDEYYRLLDPAVAAKEKIDNDRAGGVNYENGQMEARGPDRLNVAKLPTIVRDPGIASPVSTIVEGDNLDGKVKKGDYTSPDGRKGIDNRRFLVEGCINTYQGHKGYYYQYQNEQRRNKRDSVLIQISGIHDYQNDPHVQVTIVPSRDPIVKSADGQTVLANYTFRASDNPIQRYYAIRLNAKIVNGVIITDPADVIRFESGTDIEFYNGRLRLQILPNGHLKGIVAGYEDIRSVYLLAAASNQEQLYGLTTPGLYDAFRRAADGLKDPMTGDYWGISSAWQIEGTPAFISRTDSPFALAPETKRLSMR